jgi:hypothetical protein
MGLRYGRQRPSARRVFKAVAYQAKDDPIRLIAERARPKIAAALTRAFKALRNAVPEGAISARVAAGDPAGAADVVNIATFEHALRPVFEQMADAYRAAAKLGGGQITRRVAKDSSTFSGQPQQPDPWAVDLFGDDVLAELRALQDDLIGGMTDQMRQQIFATIMDGVRQNLPVEDIAAQVKTECGLSVRLAKAIRSYRAGLEQLDPTVLARALRDDSSDATIRAAIDVEQALSKEEIDDLVLAYANRALDYRAKMIAQTESTRAANMGLEAAYRQMIANGLIPAAGVRKHWRVALDEKTCGECLMVAIAANAGIGVGELFTGSDDSPVQTPPLHPNCRCSLEYITNLDLVPNAMSEAA